MLHVDGYHWEVWNVPELDDNWWCAGMFPDDKSAGKEPSHCSMGYDTPTEAIEAAEFRVWLDLVGQPE